MLSFFVADSRVADESCAAVRTQDCATDGDDDGVVDRLFFGRGVSVAHSRRVFERCRDPVLREGYVFVCLRLRREAKTPILQVVAERKDETPMTVADCATLSRFLSPLLEGEGLVSLQTRLEVSSPGLKRPLTRLRDFQRFAGREIALLLDKDCAGGARQRFGGIVAGVEGRNLVLQTNEGRLSFAIVDVAKANLVESCKALRSGRRVSRKHGRG